MQPLDTIITIAEIILFAVLIILCIYLIVSLKKITKSIEHIEGNTDELIKKVEPVLENALFITNNVKDISTGLKTQVEKVDDIVDSVKSTADSMIDFEQKTQKEIEVHVNNTLNFISAIVKGYRAFSSSLSNFKDRHPRKSKLISHSPVIEPAEEDL
jgi:uncharacterized protein YoxC